MKRWSNKTMGPLAIAIVGAALAGGLPLGQSLADDQLPVITQERTDGHISWHEFMHELASYPQINAMMSDNGMITLTGHADGGMDRIRIADLASTVRGATEIRNNLTSD